MALRARTLLLVVLGTLAGTGCGRDADDSPGAIVSSTDDSVKDVAPGFLARGREIFRFDTFGNEPFWTDTLRLHQAIEQNVDPMTALGVGLKVDADALPPGALDGADLTDPATTVALLKLNAVIGVKAKVSHDNHIEKIGITCALCHSTVDNSVMPGIGSRLDGWPNRDLNVGAIVALSPELTPEQRSVYESWGAGLYDPRFSIDGLNTPLVLPPAFGLAGIENETFTADGPVSYWNAYVAVTQMHGSGSFSDPRIGVDVDVSPDLVTPKLPALRAYQLSLETPPPPAGSFDETAAARGRTVFEQACISCHVGFTGTDNNDGVLHSAAEIGQDGAYAARTATGAYRTTPLRALWQHPPYFHDGSAATLEAVVAHYIAQFDLDLTAEEQADLVEFLKSL